MCDDSVSQQMPPLRGRVLLAALMMMVPLVVAAPALAKEPQGAFKAFKQCPRFTAGVNFCVSAEIKSGEVKIGSTAVPIKNPITLQGGYERDESKRPVKENFVGAINGETLSKTAQPVPGGLLDVVKCNEITGEGWPEKGARLACELVFENTLTGVNAVTELARPASEIGISTDNLINEEGVALSLPVKVHLENPFLGSACYVGSSTSPITLKLTDGTTEPPLPNKPITGKLGNLEIKLSEGLPYTEITDNTLVDNAFSAPVASGCGGIFSFLIDPLVDAKLGLPSGAGHNTTIQNGTQKLATAEVVVASEK